MTYVEKYTQLAADASVAVLVLSNPECDDTEFLMLKPKRPSACELADLKMRWPGRGLESVGIFALVGTSPRWALKEPLSLEQLTALADAFLAYLHALFCDALAGQQESSEVAELERLHALFDPRAEA